MTRRRRLSAALLLAGWGAVAGCGGSSSSATSNGTDAAFVLHMLPHHQRAIQVGALAAEKGSDPQVRAFGARIVREQTPEEPHLAGWVATLRLNPQPGDAMAADGYITNRQLAQLLSESGLTFDRQVLLLSARSEEGAVAMARPELAGGHYAPAHQLAAAISGAPTSEIPQLKALAARVTD